jgi:hypothetical protein
MASHSVCRTCGKKIHQEGSTWSSHLGSSCWKNGSHEPIHTVMAEKMKSAPVKVPSSLLNTDLFRAVPSSKVETPLGIHWSSVSGLEHDSNSRFETKGSGASLFAGGGGKKGEKFTIIHGKVNDKAVIDLRSSEGKKVKGRHAIWGGGHPEYEETVRPGANVEVTKLTRIRNVTDSTRDSSGTYVSAKKKTREIRYNPPRQVQA